MSAPTRATGWTELVASAVAHDINNLVHTMSSASGSSGSMDLVEDCLAELRRLAARLQTLGRTGGAGAAALVDDACADALVEVDPAGVRVLRGQPSPPGTCVRGS